MEHNPRYFYLALAVVWSLFRLFRYVRAAAARRPGPALPPSGSATISDAAPAPASVQSPAAVQSPIAPAGGRLRGALAAAGILIAANAVIWPLLFFAPGIEQVPTLPRLVVGVLANLVLIRLAGAVGTRLGKDSQPRSDDERNPIR